MGVGLFTPEKRDEWKRVTSEVRTLLRKAGKDYCFTAYSHDFDYTREMYLNQRDAGELRTWTGGSL